MHTRARKRTKRKAFIIEKYKRVGNIKRYTSVADSANVKFSHFLLLLLLLSSLLLLLLLNIPIFNWNVYDQCNPCSWESSTSLYNESINVCECVWYIRGMDIRLIQTYSKDDGAVLLFRCSQWVCVTSGWHFCLISGLALSFECLSSNQHNKFSIKPHILSLTLSLSLSCLLIKQYTHGWMVISFFFLSFAQLFFYCLL